MTTVLRRLGRSFFQRFRIHHPVLLSPPTPYEEEGEEVEEPVRAIAAANEQNREFLRDEIRRGYYSQTAAPTPVIRSNTFWNRAEWRPPRSESPQSPTQHLPMADFPAPRTYNDPCYLPQ